MGEEALALIGMHRACFSVLARRLKFSQSARLSVFLWQERSAPPLPARVSASAPHLARKSAPFLTLSGTLLRSVDPCLPHLHPRRARKSTARRGCCAFGGARAVRAAPPLSQRSACAAHPAPTRTSSRRARLAWKPSANPLRPAAPPSHRQSAPHHLRACLSACLCARLCVLSAPLRALLHTCTCLRTRGLPLTKAWRTPRESEPCAETMLARAAPR